MLYVYPNCKVTVHKDMRDFVSDFNSDSNSNDLNFNSTRTELSEFNSISGIGISKEIQFPSGIHPNSGQ